MGFRKKNAKTKGDSKASASVLLTNIVEVIVLLGYLNSLYQLVL